jgi:dCTP deaminase
MIVGDNLKQFVETQGVCHSGLCEDNSVRVRLGDTYSVQRAQPSDYRCVVEERDYTDQYESHKIQAGGLVLEPDKPVLGISADSYRVPTGFYGWLETTSTLARFFVTSHLSPFIDPGWEGPLTLELVNYGRWPVALPHQCVVARLFLATTSTVGPPYRGRYLGATTPLGD